VLSGNLSAAVLILGGFPKALATVADKSVSRLLARSYVFITGFS
jgi:hypothetical protein